MSNLDYKEVSSSESVGHYGCFGIKILVATDRDVDLSSDAVQIAVYKAEKLVLDEVKASSIAASATFKQDAEDERKSLLGLFPGRIFVETIPNGYSPDWAHRHLPWFIVTTGIGRFKVGWRKRVIHLEWTETVDTKDAEELFSGENVTMDRKMIHAWSLDKARQYIETIMASAEAQP